MTPHNYQDFSNYSKFLEIMLDNQEIYLPDELEQNLAQRMIDYIN